MQIHSFNLPKQRYEETDMGTTKGNNPDAFPEDPTLYSDVDGDGYGDNPEGNNPDAFCRYYAMEDAMEMDMETTKRKKS